MLLDLDINEDIFNTFMGIVKNEGITLQRVMLYIILNTLKYESIDWILQEYYGELNSKTIKKTNAIKLFQERGYEFKKGDTTFSTKTNNVDLYWSNPYFKMLSKKWNLILNDPINKKLYLFIIPEKNDLELKPKSDDSGKYDVSIKYNDSSFTDIRSGICFKKYLKDEIFYDKLL